MYSAHARASGPADLKEVTGKSSGGKILGQLLTYRRRLFRLEDGNVLPVWQKHLFSARLTSSLKPPHVRKSVPEDRPVAYVTAYTRLAVSWTPAVRRIACYCFTVVLLHPTTSSTSLFVFEFSCVLNAPQEREPRSRSGSSRELRSFCFILTWDKQY